MEDSQAAGRPAIVTVDRGNAVQQRAASLRGIPTIRNLDRDEYPPAVFKEGGSGASVRHIPFSDNRGSGAVLGNQLKAYRMVLKLDLYRLTIQVTITRTHEIAWKTSIN